MTRIPVRSRRSTLATIDNAALVVVALVVAVVAFKILGAVFGFVFGLVWFLFKVAAVVALAYLVFRALRSRAR